MEEMMDGVGTASSRRSSSSEEKMLDREIASERQRVSGTPLDNEIRQILKANGGLPGRPRGTSNSGCSAASSASSAESELRRTMAATPQQSTPSHVRKAPRSGSRTVRFAST